MGHHEVDLQEPISQFNPPMVLPQSGLSHDTNYHSIKGET